MQEHDQEASRPNTPHPLHGARIDHAHFRWIWGVPIAALCLVIYLGWVSFGHRGPTITITFTSAEGLEAGRTKIRDKDVDVGTVDKVELSHDLTHVTVTASMNSEVSDYINDGTQFWVVRPRFGAGGISGLDTLVSGSYIMMQPGKGNDTHSFKGLNNPPIALPDGAGRRFVVSTTHLGSVGQGSPVFYHGIEAGEVLGYKLSDDAQQVNIFLYVRSPYDRLVKDDSRFWSAGGLAITTGANGIQVNTDSLQAVLVGGLVFDMPPEIADKPESAADKSFMLYDDYNKAHAESRGPRFPYMMQFPGPVQGIAPDTEVTLNGIRVGRVVDVHMEYDQRDGVLRTPVTIEIETDYLKDFGLKGQVNRQEALNRVLDRLIQKGLRARLASGSLLTGQRLVALDMQTPDELEGQPEKHLLLGGPAPEIPTIAAGSIDDVTRAATNVLHNMEKVTKNLDSLTGSPELQETVKSLNQTLQDLDHLVNDTNSSVSPVGRELPQMIEEVKDAARSIKTLTDFLDEHPESLIVGRQEK
jgi:paraquat-inducible protein B